ncbi:MAG: YdeI/OmpD-associated family protein [Nibricoccus sp.]
MKNTPKPQTLSFSATLERVAEDMEYFGLSVPQKITDELGTKAAVLVSARVNGSTPFQVSLHPVGGGRHAMRVKAKVWKEVKITEGDRVKVEVTVIDRAAVPVPGDLLTALQEVKLVEAFKALTPGKRAYAIRLIEQAVKPETRAKRVQEAVDLARGRSGK